MLSVKLLVLSIRNPFHFTRSSFSKQLHKMCALKFCAATKELKLMQTEIPNISTKDGVLIKVAYAGICGTDLHIMQGDFPCAKDRAITLGHEFCGIVEQVGSDVKDLKPCDCVTVDPSINCNSCKFCRIGKPHFCSVSGTNNFTGIYSDGGWAEYCLVPAGQVYKLPIDLLLKHSVLTQPMSCICHGVDLSYPINIGTKILILGAGIIGNLCACLLHLQGHRNVTICDINKERLKSSEKLQTCYELVTPEIFQKNLSFDFIMDCSGAPSALECAVSMLRKGGRLVCFGVASKEDKIKIKPYDVFMKELKIYGSFINQFSFSKALDVLEVMGERYLNFRNLGIEKYELKDYDTAIRCLKDGKITKAVLKIDM